MNEEKPNQCSYEGCNREVFWPKNYTPKPEEKPFCIFHSPLNEEKKEQFKIAWEVFLKEHTNNRAEYENINCRGFVFPINIHFHGAESGRAAFFTKPKFRGEVDFKEVTFSGMATFWDAQFSDTAFFAGAKFVKAADFLRTTFNGNADFSRATFGAVGTFAGAKFCAEGDFRGTIFKKMAAFWDTTFKSSAYFDRAMFDNKALFFGTMFKEASFGGAVFRGECLFHQIHFRGSACFSRARFEECNLEIIGARISELKIKNENTTRVFVGNYIEIDHVNFSGAKRVRFEHVDLSSATLLRSRIENIDFIDVWWNGPEGYKLYDERKWRNAGIQSRTEPSSQPSPIGKGQGEGNVSRYPNLPYRLSTLGRDWIHARFQATINEYRTIKRTDKDQLKEIENIYHQLVLNYDRRREYETGGEFYVRENEIRRLRKGFPDNIWEVLYCYTSEYGQRWAWPLIWSMLVIFISSLIFYFGLSQDHPVLFNLSFLLGLHNITSLPTLSNHLALGVGIERLLLIYLLSMFFLALRRRFRR